MRSIFGKIVLAAAFSVAAALAANSAQAATRVNVPFNFKVAGATLPAGSYHIVHDSTSAFVTLRGVESNESYTWLLSPGPSERSTKIALRFTDHNGTKVLESIQYGSLTTPHLDKGKSIDLERESRGQ
jgi:hypothetical protein